MNPFTESQESPIGPLTTLQREAIGRCASEIGESLAAVPGASRQADASREQSEGEVSSVVDTPGGGDADVASLRRELRAAREAARVASASEALLREQLAAVRVRCQEIVDAQTLQVTELKRRLEQVSAEARLARAETEAPREAEARQSRTVTSVVKSRLPATPGGNDRAIRFEAIEAVLADSPPIGAKQTARL